MRDLDHYRRILTTLHAESDKHREKAPPSYAHLQTELLIGICEELKELSASIEGLHSDIAGG